jgi:exodeoxyribonuclease V alpha subunit
MDQVQPSLNLFDERRSYIKGKLLHEIFHNPENLYSVTRIRIIETTESTSEKEMIIVGTFPPLVDEEVYTFWGLIKNHPKFGTQYHIEGFRKEIPQGRDGLVHYLSSDLFPGIGKKLASNIIDTLGDKAIQLILENPQSLDEVPQLNEEKRKLVYDRLMEYQGLEQIMVKLGEYGIGLTLSVQIYRHYYDQSMEILQNNPYKLIDDIEGIGFKRADLIGKAMGIEHDSPERIRAACTYFLREQSEQNGHVYYPLEHFLVAVKEWLNREGEMVQSASSIDELMISKQVIEMGEEGKLMVEEDRVYLPSLFYAEKGFAKKVKQLVSNEEEQDITNQEFYAVLGGLEERLGIEYAETQREAIEKAIYSSFMILTGGPGTGKTTVIKGVCEAFAQIHNLSLDPKDYIKKEEPFPIILIAPTGRAAKRMSESTGIPAVTIHRLLGWKGGKDFDHSEDNPIDGRLVIVDESSMMDQWLANQLFRSLSEKMKVILVGDQDQLPSVGPGQVLKDLIESERIPVVELKEIYRQAQGSSIITLAHQMKRGELPQDLLESKTDRRFFPCTSGTVVDVVKQVCSSALRKGYTTKDVQVLAPMYKGEAGIDAINKALQEEFNPKVEGKRELSWGELNFRVGDKVLQLVNNPEENVFNGDIGEIVAIIYAKENVDKEDQLVVSFDQTEVTYTRNELNQLTLAYCCSVHKSQGSEFPIVVIPVVRQYFRMLRRNLVYTAITRGKDFLILCGEESAFLDSIKHNDVAERYTSLTLTLQEWMPLIMESNPSYEL